MNEKVLAVRDVTKVFDEGRQRVQVLKGITMDVAAGEVVALEGPSGSGKTTLLSIMGCILTPSSGELEVAGRRVVGSDAAALRDVRRRRSASCSSSTTCSRRSRRSRTSSTR